MSLPTPLPGPGPYRVCFVCTGNICRSPMAEAVLRRMVAEAGLAGRVEVCSRGMGPWHVGQPAEAAAMRVLRRHGYPLDHAARQWQPAEFASCDLVVALDAGHYRQLTQLARTDADRAKIRLLRSYDPAAGADLSVPDPYYEPDEAFEHVLELVEAGCRGILAEISCTAR